MEPLGIIVSTMESPSPSRIDFVVNKGKAHKGMFIELDYSEGTLIAMVDELIKTNRYFERPDSVKALGEELEKNFPANDWEFLIAKAKPLGVFSKNLVQRSTFPPSPGTKVFKAGDEIIKKFLKLEEEGLNLGKIQFHDVEMKLNLSKLLQKHLAVLAMSGAGKCLKPDTKIKLSDGRIVKIQSIVDDALKEERVVVDGVETSTKNKDDLFVFGINSNNKIVKSKIKAFMRRKAPEKVIKIKTASGRELELTKEHPLPIFDDGVNWIPAEQLKEGDYSFVPRIITDSKEMEIDLAKYFDKKYFTSKSRFMIYKRRNAKEIPAKIKIDENFARFLAYLLAEGHNTGKYIVFSNNNSKVMSDFIFLSEKLFSEIPHRINKGEVRIYSNVLAQAMSQIGFTNSSWIKTIPNEILQSPRKVQWAFLSAFIDCDGGFSDKALEITLASKSMVESINELFLQNDIIPRLKDKKFKGKNYKRLFVSGSNNMKILLKYTNLRIDYKKKELTKLSLKINNSNVDVFPNCSQSIKNIFKTLNLPTITSGNYIYNRKNPSIDQVKNLAISAEKRFFEVQLMVARLKEIFYSLPNISEEYAKEVICDAYGEFDFNEISNNSGVSSTTARRIARGITNPKFSSFVLAQNCLKLKGEADLGIKTILNLKFQKLSKELNNICKDLGFEVNNLLSENNFNKGLVYSWAKKDSILNYSNFYSFAKTVFKQAFLLEQKLNCVEKQISDLKNISSSKIFFDKIISIEEKRPDYEWVYDLSVEHSSFVANNLLVHNSYFQSVLIEELQKRKKEQGQIATIVFDTHGEYTSFGEAVTSSEYTDFSSNTRIIEASKIKIATSNMNKAMISSIIPSITPVQKRELFKIISKLREEMKSGVGPFDLNSLRAEIGSLDQKTAIPLLAAIDELEQLRLFSKIDEPFVLDLAKPGQLTIIDLNNIISEKKKQIIVSYISQKLFNARRIKKVCPFAVLVEEAHNFIPETTAAEYALAKPILRTFHPHK